MYHIILHFTVLQVATLVANSESKNIYIIYLELIAMFPLSLWVPQHIVSFFLVVHLGFFKGGLHCVKVRALTRLSCRPPHHVLGWLLKVQPSPKLTKGRGWSWTPKDPCSYALTADIQNFGEMIQHLLNKYYI